MDILKFPLARITICFVLGIATATQIAIPLNQLWVLSAALVVVVVACFYFANRHFTQRVYFGICVALVSVIIGMLTHSVHFNSGRATRFTTKITTDSIHNIEMVLRERLKNTASNSRFVAYVRRIDNVAASGKILINIARDKPKPSIAVGSLIVASGPVYIHQPPTNPGQFDYGSYLRNKSVYAQMYVDPRQITVGSQIQKDIWYYSDKLRTTILTNLGKSNFPSAELSVFSALILGQQQDISKEILRDYQYAGAVHILSVSGLHVGLILLFLNFLLKPLPNTAFASCFRIAIVVIFLWCFAVIAGLSPSVVRSVTMFSFVAIGMHLKRETNIYHTLLVSLLLILLIQPAFLFDVGFQLSYTALFFILWLQPLFSALWRPKYKLTKYFWDIFTVSVAAQIGAFPLSVYYFHQFPGLFFVTNLAIVPFISVIMALGVVTMIIAIFTPVPTLLATVLKTAISWLNAIVDHIASFESFVVRDIPFNIEFMLASYFVIILLVMALKRPTYAGYMSALTAVLLMQTIHIGNRWKSHNETELVIFDVRKSTLIAERKFGTTDTYSNDTLQHAALQPYLTANFSNIGHRHPVQNLLYFNDTKIAIVDSAAILPQIQFDVLLLRQSPRLNLDRLLRDHHPKAIVADGSNYRSYVARWKQSCTKAKIPFHYTGEKGFYRIR